MVLPPTQKREKKIGLLYIYLYEPLVLLVVPSTQLICLLSEFILPRTETAAWVNIGKESLATHELCVGH